MKRIKEMFSQITKKAWIVIGVVVVVVLLGAGATVVYSKNPNMWPVSLFAKKDSIIKDNVKTDVFVSEATDKIFTKENIARGEYLNDTKSATTYVNNTEEVRVAVVADKEAQKVLGDTKKISCGHIAFVTVRVAGPAVLTNSLKALFEDRVLADFVPGNIIPKYHPDLKLQKVMIDNGVAKVYLSGNFSGEKDGWCDASLAVAQITETAKTFPNITSVEVYQGDKKIY